MFHFGYGDKGFWRLVIKSNKKVLLNAMSQASLVVQQERICQCRRHGFDPWVGKIPWGRIWQPIPVFLPGKSHGQKRVGPEKQKAEIKQSGTWMRP